MEWSEANKYCSFSSAKGLTYYDNFLKIVGWLEGKNRLPPPIECNLDPYAECNLSCYFCITQRYLRNQRAEVGEMRKLPTEYMYRLVDFIANWGVKGLCISGGGEPSLHQGTWGLPSYATQKGLDVAYVTNGVRISDELAQNLMCCKWVTFSVDAGDKRTYLKVKGKDGFQAVIDNIARVAQLRRIQQSNVALAFCSLILPENVHSLHKACRLARELGVQVFYARPVDFQRPDIKGAKPLAFDMPRVREELARCHEEETKDFRVVTSTHKFNADLHVKHDFSRCFAALILPILTDGNGYLCVDKKMESKYRLGAAYPDPGQILEWWGSDHHRQMMLGVDISSCSRCTGGPYNRQIEEVVIDDRMMRNFP